MTSFTLCLVWYENFIGCDHQAPGNCQLESLGDGDLSFSCIIQIVHLGHKIHHSRLVSFRKACLFISLKNAVYFWSVLWWNSKLTGIIFQVYSGGVFSLPYRSLFGKVRAYECVCFSYCFFFVLGDGDGTLLLCHQKPKFWSMAIPLWTSPILFDLRS